MRIYLASLILFFGLAACSTTPEEAIEKSYKDCKAGMERAVTDQKSVVETLTTQLEDGYIYKRNSTGECAQYGKYNSGRTYCKKYVYETDYIPIDHNEWRRKLSKETMVHRQLINEKNKIDSMCETLRTSNLRSLETEKLILETQKESKKALLKAKSMRVKEIKELRILEKAALKSGDEKALQKHKAEIAEKEAEIIQVEEMLQKLQNTANARGIKI